jgi:peroxisomal 2,4-dienoyl-CoA reductase
MGTYNTIKATLPYVRESRGAYIHVSATLHYRGTPYQVCFDGGANAPN